MTSRCLRRPKGITTCGSGHTVHKHPAHQAKPSPQQAALRNELIECIRSAMTTLRDRERLILTLRYVEGLKCQKIADILNIGMSAVKMRIHRARLVVRQVSTRICRQFLLVG